MLLLQSSTVSLQANLFSFCSAVSLSDPYWVTYFPLHHLFNQPFLWFHSLSVLPSSISFCYSFLCSWPLRYLYRPGLTFCGLFILSHSSSSSSFLSCTRLWLICAIILSSSIRVLSLFWRLVNSQLMIYQILITACWKPHSLSWCMVMIVPVWLPELQQTHSFFFPRPLFSLPPLYNCLSFTNCFSFSLPLQLSWCVS